MYYYTGVHISLGILVSLGTLVSIGTLVPNNKDQQGKLWLLDSLENNLTITFPSNTGHKSLSSEILAP